MKLKNTILQARLFGRHALALILFAGFVQTSDSVAAPIPGSFPGKWSTVGRASVDSTPDGLRIGNGMAVTEQSWKDCELNFRARMPANAEQVQIWSAVRIRDRGSFYAIGYRGGVEPQLSLARYAPDGQSKFLGWAPLDPAPKPGEWANFRIMVSGKRFQVYVNGEELPRINVEDKDALWEEGGVGLGGGWLPAEFASPKVEELSAGRLEDFKKIGDQVWALPSVDKKAEREKQRAAYQPAKIDALPEGRGEISLNGHWLFMPDQEMEDGVSAEAVALEGANDQNWHVLAVPSFWTPTIGWLHGELGLPGLKDAQANKGPSDKLMAAEFDRVNALTFDWRKTKSGWYRHHLELPADLGGRNYELVFDAIAKVSEVWVNGRRAAANVGMFRQVRCDITPHLKPGRNVIAVHDIGNPDRQVRDANKVADVAVTVEVTFEMLNSLPHGMTDNNSGGIWQPVHLVVTNPVRIGAVHIVPSIDGMKAVVQVENRGSSAVQAVLASRIANVKGGESLPARLQPQAVALTPGEKKEVEISASGLNPKLWSPAIPNLYALELDLSSGGKALDHKSERFGFRTFTVQDGKFMLNGKPFWLRGGNHFPVTLRPNDGELARKFIQLAKEGNINVTRSHAIPFTEAWFAAADELGMGVSYEGTWPWLMLNGPTPDAELVKIWHEEFASLIERHRNHPSLLFWTINNEMQFYKKETLGEEVLMEKWKVLDSMIRDIRKLDPTRPIVPDSAYSRKAADKKFPDFREKNHFDDGDIDDTHGYFGWYNESFFHFFEGRFGNDSTPGRPLISQELSTGYPRNDDWPSRSYQFQRYVPQALVGNYAFEGNDPALFMARQTLMTKEIAEVIRRTNRDNANGILHFAYLTWFTDVWLKDSIRPKMTYYGLQAALQPVLVSAELYGRHFYAGDSWKHRVCIANDIEDCSDLPAGTLAWKISHEGQVLAQGTETTAPVPYYSNQWLDLSIALPASLPAPRVNAVVSYELNVGGKVVSSNTYDIVVATRDWAGAAAGKVAGKLFDPGNKAEAAVKDLKLEKITSLGRLEANSLLVVGDLAALLKESQGAEKFRKFVEEGGRALVLNGGEDLVKLLPDHIRSFRKTQGEIVNMEIPESPVFDGIEPLDMVWFEMGDRKVPYACSGTYEADRSKEGVEVLAHECKFHPDIKPGEFFKNAGAPIVGIRIGKGRVLASEMMLSARDRDPVAAKLLSNLLSYLGSATAPF